MPCGNNGLEPINCFALVTYIPDPLGSFLDELRRELVPECAPHAHVTVLPPRPLFSPAETAVEELASRISDLPAFEVEAGDIEIFENTSVIYIGVVEGHSELTRLNGILNTGALQFAEPFPYHPHLTVAQELRSEDVERLFATAKRRWAEYQGTRTFAVETLSFVQNTAQNRWLDLAHWTLGAVPLSR